MIETEKDILDALIDAETELLATKQDLAKVRVRFYREVVDVCAPCNKVRGDTIRDVCPACPLWPKKQTIIAELEQLRSRYIEAKKKVAYFTKLLR